MIQLTDKEIAQETEFPPTGATETESCIKANGWNIYYIDNREEAQSIFVAFKNLHDALQYFERRIDYAIIDKCRMAIMD